MLTSTDMVGKRIRTLRESRGLKQSEVADKIGMQRSSYSKVEAGIYVLQPDYCVALAELFDTSCDYILRGVEAENLHFSKESGFSNKSINVLKNTEDRGCVLRFLNRILESDDFLSLSRQYLSYCLAERIRKEYSSATFADKQDQEFWEAQGIPFEMIKKRDAQLFGKLDDDLYIFSIPGYLDDRAETELYKLIKLFEKIISEERSTEIYGHKPDESNERRKTIL